ncbi:Gonadotropin-releasing hormone II receptor, partial [Lamellibrachia satsuma]
SPLPREMTFTDDNLVSVVAYALLFVIAAFGNLSVFVAMFRSRRRRSRVNLFIMHLCVADLIVTFVVMPLEITWQLTVAWLAGDIACRIMMFFRAFGFYLSSFILVTISLDRYFAIIKPMSFHDVSNRSKLMLLFAWLGSAVASVPQSVIFHVESHPRFKWYEQCVTFNFFPSPAHEMAYNLFNITAVYVVPLIVITVVYSLILCEITRKDRESRVVTPCSNYQGHGRLRQTGIGRFRQARNRTLKMTIVIVLVFIFCWTPYFVISAWWWFDKTSASQINPKVQRSLFLFAVSNSCMDPIIYGE